MLRVCLALLLLRSNLIAHRRCRGCPHVAISRKWLVNGYAGRTAMIDVGKLISVRACKSFVLYLCSHWCGVRLSKRR